jgi:putative exporter of polyketide antibiotics
MKVAAWVITVVLLVAGVAIFVEALTTPHTVWLSIPLLLLSGVFTGPGVITLLALCGLYDLAIELNGHRLEFGRRTAD